MQRNTLDDKIPPPPQKRYYAATLPCMIKKNKNIFLNIFFQD